MQYVQLGRSGVKVSRLCLGTMNIGPLVDEPLAHAMLSRFCDAGLNFIDTANVYGTWHGRNPEDHRGWTEEIIGRWIKNNPGRRDQIVLATKVYLDIASGPNDRGLSAYHIRRACDESLRRLQTDCIDLYQMHHVQRTTTWDEIWQAFDILIRQGKIVYVGSSNFAGWDIATACLTAKERKMLGPISEQTKYNLSGRVPELEVIPACRHFGLGLIPWSPLDMGLLAGVLKAGQRDRRNHEWVANRVEPLRAKLQRYEDLCDQLGHPPAQVALAWLLHNPVVTAPIIGPRTMQQLEDTLPVLDLKLDEATLKKLDEIWPGPGGEAPKAYAW
ncbi:MAG: aldo/keto reductase [Phycisphaeraceae bacterium]|nr:aldo/keto reductase [Phycisphaeraceae bacterium]